jgi:hypothetical protein
MQDQQVQRRANPVFATNFALEAEIKTNKENQKEREALFRLVFFDNKTKFTVGEVIISRLTAIDLEKSINEMLVKVNKTLKSRKLPKKPELKTETVDKPTYLG